MYKYIVVTEEGYVGGTNDEETVKRGCKMNGALIIDRENCRVHNPETEEWDDIRGVHLVEKPVESISDMLVQMINATGTDKLQ